MIYPGKLEKGDLIKIISPSNGIIKEKKIKQLEDAKKYLVSKGYVVEEDKYVRNSIFGASSSDVDRALEFNKNMDDSSVKAMMACSGGDFLNQMLDYVKFNKIKNNVKWIQGQSDITSLLYYITTKYDIATIYNFNVKTYGDSSIPQEMLDNSISLLENKNIVQREYGYQIKEENENISWKCINEFKPIKGRLIGGCLESLKDLIGTKYDCTKKFIEKYKDDGIVWYFDIYSMSNEDILRTMWQLKHLGWFKYTKGILFGRLYEEINYTGISFENVVQYYLKDLNVPILINTDIGHTDPVMSLVNGAIVKINHNNVFEMETIFE